jgi:hypothetical protein
MLLLLLLLLPGTKVAAAAGLVWRYVRYVTC